MMKDLSLERNEGYDPMNNLELWCNEQLKAMNELNNSELWGEPMGNHE